MHLSLQFKFDSGSHPFLFNTQHPGGCYSNILEDAVNKNNHVGLLLFILMLHLLCCQKNIFHHIEVTLTFNDGSLQCCMSPSHLIRLYVRNFQPVRQGTLVCHGWLAVGVWERVTY